MGEVRLLAFAALFLAMVFGSPASAADPPAPSNEAAERQRVHDILAGMNPQGGDIHLEEAAATLHLGETYLFLGKEDARKVLVDLWRNPPETAEGVLGIVFPKAGDFPAGWGAVITYEHTFYVSDDDAKTADYDALLKSKREGEAADNAERVKAGYPSMELVGWAQPPSYDATRHTMIWAQDLKTSDTDIHTLNYDVRVLGREGVLSLNMVASMPELTEVRADAGQLAQIVAYDPGRRYTDYVDGDKKAGYGLAGLVAAGLGAAAAKKVGLLAILAIVLKKGAVFIAAAAAGVVAWFRRLFGLKAKTPPTTRPATPDEPYLETDADRADGEGGPPGDRG